MGVYYGPSLRNVVHVASTQVEGRALASNRTIQVLLVEGNPLFRQAVRACLEEAPDIIVIGEAAHAREAEWALARARPDVVLLDASNSRNAVAQTTAGLKEAYPRSAIVVVGDADTETLIDAVEAGANGYVTQESAMTDLIQTTRSVFEGRTLIPPTMLGGLVTGLVSRRREEHEALGRLSRLTHREREVLDLLAAGKNNQGIARALSISPETVRTHVQNVLAKLEVHSRLEAAAFLLGLHSLVSPKRPRSLA